METKLIPNLIHYIKIQGSRPPSPNDELALSGSNPKIHQSLISSVFLYY